MHWSWAASLLWRRLICRERWIGVTDLSFAGAGISDSVFLMYGSHFARLLGLPEKPNYYDPIIVQLPTRYRPLFTEGCEAASAAPAAAKFNGAVVHNGSTELYRGGIHAAETTGPFSHGSFNYGTLARLPERWRERSA